MTKTTLEYGKGAAEWVGSKDRGAWFARISVPGEGRRRHKLYRADGTPLTDKEGDRVEAKALTAEISESIRAHHFEQEARRISGRTTVREFATMWTSGELYRQHGEVRRLRPKKSVADDVHRFELHVFPYIGHKAVADVTEQDIEQCLARAAADAERRRGRPWRQGTKVHVYQILKRLFDLAIRPGRLRTDNPVTTDVRPAKDVPKLYSFLFPAELQALLACAEIPLTRRVHYALAVYTGLRKGSLRALRWDGLDFTHGTLTSLESKTGLPQMFQIAPDLVALLSRYHALCGSPPGTEKVIGDLRCKPGREAEALRADLQAAGVDRNDLFSTAQNVERLRFHDMRATFVTWARRAGRGSGWISDRTGHLTDEMMRRYDRGARTLESLNMKPFPDLTDAIPELSSNLSNITPIDAKRRPGAR